MHLNILVGMPVQGIEIAHALRFLAGQCAEGIIQRLGIQRRHCPQLCAGGLLPRPQAVGE